MDINCKYELENGITDPKIMELKRWKLFLENKIFSANNGFGPIP